MHIIFPFADNHTKLLANYDDPSEAMLHLKDRIETATATKADEKKAFDEWRKANTAYIEWKGSMDRLNEPSVWLTVRATISRLGRVGSR